MRVVFRVDASNQIGMGHLSRCLTLVKQLKKFGCTIAILTRSMPLGTVNTLKEQQVDVISLLESDDDLLSCLAYLRKCSEKPDWFVIDHYEWDQVQETACRPYVQKMMVIDDLANRPHDCNLLVDQNYFVSADCRYKGLVPSSARLLLGPYFALLKPEFARLRKNQSAAAQPARNILISFGGSDPHNTTLKVLEALKSLPQMQDWRIRVVIGGYHASRESVEDAASKIPNCECLYFTQDMAEHMCWAELYIGAGGTTTWERLCLGLPGIVLPIAKNQSMLSHELAKEGIQLVLPMPLDETLLRHAVVTLMENAALREAFLRKGMNLVDGIGVERVTNIMRFTGHITLRRVRKEDEANLYEWRNHPSNRQYSFQSDIISEETHHTWFRQSLANPERIILIGESGGQPLGVLRYDLQTDHHDKPQALVSIYLCPGWKGQGIGGLILEAGNAWLLRNHPQVERIEARVFSANHASRRAFEKAGYQEIKRIYYKDLT